MKTQLLLVASTLSLFACANPGVLGHISHPSKVALNIVPDHKLKLVSDRVEGIHSLAEIKDAQTIETYKKNHKVTVICPRFMFAGTEATTDTTNISTPITFLNGERVLYRSVCHIENAKPDNATYYSMPLDTERETAQQQPAQQQPAQ